MFCCLHAFLLAALQRKIPVTHDYLESRKKDLDDLVLLEAVADNPPPK